MDIRLTDVTQRLKNKQNLRECLPLGSREYGEHHTCVGAVDVTEGDDPIILVWGPLKCAFEILEGRHQHCGDVRCPPLTLFK